MRQLSGALMMRMKAMFQRQPPAEDAAVDVHSRPTNLNRQLKVNTDSTDGASAYRPLAAATKYA